MLELTKAWLDGIRVGDQSDHLVELMPHARVNLFRCQHSTHELLCGLLAEIDRVPVAARVQRACTLEVLTAIRSRLAITRSALTRPVHLRRLRRTRSCCGFRDLHRIRWLGRRARRPGRLRRASPSTRSWGRRTR